MTVTITSTSTLLCADDVPPQPWRNGGGRTRELLAWPSTADWALRISLADIAADGPFSRFAGAQRWFTVVDGAGVTLHFGNASQQLTPRDAPLCFDGALAPMCRLLNGPTRDLNLMTRSGTGLMQTLRADEAWVHAAPQRGLFCTAPGLWRCSDGRQQHLAAHSLLWLTDASALTFNFDDSSGPAWWLAFDPQGARG